jgi:hypothetical protein
MCQRGAVRGLYVVTAVTMAGVSSVFALLAELEQRYAPPTASLGWIAGSAFLAALVTQLNLSRYADRGYGRLLLRGGVALSAIGLLWFRLATGLWQFVAARVRGGVGALGRRHRPAHGVLRLRRLPAAGARPRRAPRPPGSGAVAGHAGGGGRCGPAPGRRRGPGPGRGRRLGCGRRRCLHCVPLFAWLGAGPAWLIAAIVMAGL